MTRSAPRPLIRTAPAIALVLLAGCSAVQHSDEALDLSKRSRAKISSEIDDFKRKMTDKERRLQASIVDRPWLVGRAVPLAREVTLPEALRRDVNTALMFQGSATDLQTIAKRVQMATGIHTRVTADALMPQEAFAPRLSGEKTGAVETVVPMDAQARLPDGVTSLPNALDGLTANLGVHWRYDSKNQVIVFYRVETRSFDVRALLMSAQVNAGIGLDGRSSGSQDSKSGSNFDSTSKTSLKSEDKVSPIQSVMAKITPFLTKAGSAVAEPSGTNSIVVTDTVEALDRIGKFVESENRALTRRVHMMFEEVTVTVNDQHEGGLDWNLIYSTASAVAASTSPVTSVGSTAGTVIEGSAQSGRFVGTDAIIQALSELGTTTRKTSIPLDALNRRPVTYADRKTFTYINEVETTGLSTADSGAGSISTVPNVSVRQKDVTVGQFLTLVPDAQADGQILLTVSYDSTINDPLQTIKFGDSDNGIEIQQLTVRGNGMVQQVALSPGQPMVISGFQKNQDQTTRRRLDDKAPLLFGGSNATNVQRIYTLIIVTAQVEEGF